MADPRRSFVETPEEVAPRRRPGTSAPSTGSGGGGVTDPGASANARPRGIPPVPQNVNELGWGNWLITIARTLNLVLGGKINATAQVTLALNATSTVITDSRLGRGSHMQLTPVTASAAAALASGGLYVECATGGATIRHPSSPLGDRTFSVLIIG